MHCQTSLGKSSTQELDNLIENMNYTIDAIQRIYTYSSHPYFLVTLLSLYFGMIEFVACCRVLLHFLIQAIHSQGCILVRSLDNINVSYIINAMQAHKYSLLVKCPITEQILFMFNTFML